MDGLEGGCSVPTPYGALAADAMFELITTSTPPALRRQPRLINGIDLTHSCRLMMIEDTAAAYASC